MKFKSEILLLAAAITMSGCKSVQLQDGRIPNAFLSYAHKIEGRYSGLFNNEIIHLDIKVIGDYVEVSTDSDLIGIGCNTKIDDVLSVEARVNPYSVEEVTAKIGIHSSSCSDRIIEEILYVKILESENNINLRLSILKQKESNLYLTGELKKEI